MLDRKFVVENAALVAENCTKRNSPADVAGFVELEQKRRTQQQKIDELNRQANEVSKSIGATKDPAEREARKEQGGNCASNIPPRKLSWNNSSPRLMRSCARFESVASQRTSRQRRWIESGNRTWQNTDS